MWSSILKTFKPPFTIMQCMPGEAPALHTSKRRPANSSCRTTSSPALSRRFVDSSMTGVSGPCWRRLVQRSRHSAPPPPHISLHAHRLQKTCPRPCFSISIPPRPAPAPPRLPLLFEAADAMTQRLYTSTTRSRCVAVLLYSREETGERRKRGRVLWRCCCCLFLP